MLAYTPGMIGSATAMKACGDTKPASCAYNLAPVGAGPFQKSSRFYTGTRGTTFDLAKAKALVAEVKKNYDLSCWGFNVYEDDPFISLNQNLHSKSAGNWIGYNNPEVDKLFDQAVAAKSDAERKTALDGIAVTVSDYAVFDKAWIG